MPQGNVNALLNGKDGDARSRIARRVGGHLCAEDLPEVERRAAESLARCLVADAIDRVRIELSKAVRAAPHLPRDLALKIAHDVDAVACPFLQATDVFSETDWKQLVLTVSRGARVAVAMRTSMSEGLAFALAEVSDSVVAQALVENPAAPMTPPVCDTIIERFEGSVWVLDKLAERDDLFAETAGHLISKVSLAVRQKLAGSYGLSHDADDIAQASEHAALLGLIRRVPGPRLPGLVQHMRDSRQLSYALMLAALRDGSLEFFEAALSLLAGAEPNAVRRLVDSGSDGTLTGLLSRAGIPHDIYAEVWEQLKRVRTERRAAH